MSFVRMELRKSAAAAPLTVTSPMWEMSKMPAALRTARCSSTMLVYCTGISQPPKSISLAPSFWCAEKSAVRLSMVAGYQLKVENGKRPATPVFNLQLISTPFLRFHLFFGRAQAAQHHFLGKLDERVWTAGVKNRVCRVHDMRLDPLRRDTARAAVPGMFRFQARAGDVKFEVRVFLFQLAEFTVEDDVAGRANAIKHGNFCLQFAPGGFAHEPAEWRHARTAGNADEVLVRLKHGQKFPDGRDNEKFIAGLCPIHDARAHLAVALDGDLVKAAVQRAGRERVGALVIRRVRPVERDELAVLEIRVVAVRPFEPDGFGVGQFPRSQFHRHFGYFSDHKFFVSARK